MKNSFTGRMFFTFPEESIPAETLLRLPVRRVEKTSEQRARFEMHRKRAARARFRLMTPEKTLYNMKTEGPGALRGGIPELEPLTAEGEMSLPCRKVAWQGVSRSRYFTPIFLIKAPSGEFEERRVGFRPH